MTLEIGLGIAVGAAFVVALLWVLKTVMSPLSVKETGNPVAVDRQALYDHVMYLSTASPARTIGYLRILNETADYIQAQFESHGLSPELQEYQVEEGKVRNVIVQLGPTHKPRIVIGAHYDVCGEQPGADDNASGVAGLIELARVLKENESLLTHHFELVAYTLEEPPYFGTDLMGSAVHAKALHDAGAEVALMVSLEMIGYFTDEPDSQKFPSGLLEGLYPTVGNFIALVGNLKSKHTLERLKRPMLAASKVPLYSISSPGIVEGVDFSDHRNYWRYGYPAMMLTDTAYFRNPNYHSRTDTIDTLDFEKMALVIEALAWGVLEF